MAEVAKHDSLDDAWLVIDGQVYDISSWIQEHPGGIWLLLAFAGQDASKPFETMGHSAVARKQLRSLHVGSAAEGPPIPIQEKATPQEKARNDNRKATLTGGPVVPAKERGSLWAVEDHGFLPNRDPVPVEALIGTAFEAWVELMDLLPSLGFTGSLRGKLDGDKELQEKLLRSAEPEAIAELSEEQLERAFAVATYGMVAFWRGGTLQYSQGLGANCITSAGAPVTASTCPVTGSCAIEEEIETLPAYLAKPLHALSKAVGRPPMIDYASSVLYNWVRIDRDGPITMSNVRCALRLTGLIDEEWFFKTHVVIESEASHAVSAVIGATKAVDDAELLSHLVALEEALWRVVRACLPIMYERSSDGTPKCSEHIFYQILRPLIKSGSLFMEGTEEKDAVFLSGPSGAMSSLLPAIDAALGIPMTSQKLREGMAKFKLSMPITHQRFIDDLLAMPNIRQRIQATRPVGTGEDGEEDHHNALVRAFNRVISRVLDFRWQHWQFVKNFIMKPGNISHAVGSGGTSFDYLQQHITDTEKARLKERHEAGQTRIATPAMPEWPPLRVPPASPYPSQEFWSVDGDHGMLAREPLVAPSKAPWASSLSPALLKAFEVTWNLAARLPAVLVAGGPIAETIQQAEPLLQALQDDRALLGLSEGAREHLMTTLCHISAGYTGSTRKKPPNSIVKPLNIVSRSVGRPPRLNFCELVLTNWDAHPGAPVIMQKKVPPEDTESMISQAEAEAEAVQLHVVWRFIGAPDEEWYRGIHIVMHREARDVVSAIRIGHVSMRDHNDGGIVSSLEQISAWFNKFCDYFDYHFESKGSRTEAVMIRRLEPFIAQSQTFAPGLMSREETAAWVYCCGSSVLLPAVHAFVGVQQCPKNMREAEAPVGGSETLAHTVRRTLEEGRVYMPRPHLAFLESLEKPGVSIRQYCFRRFGAKRMSVEVLHDLEVAYNDVLNSLGRFVSRRVHLVSRFFPQMASSFGALQSEYEGHLRVERLQLLKMRQRISRRLER